MLLRDWVLAILVMGLGLTALGFMGSLNGVLAYGLIAICIVAGCAMIVIDDWKNRRRGTPL